VVDLKVRELKADVVHSTKVRVCSQKNDLYQRQRMETDLTIVSRVGYTSSGTTTLSNLLTKSNKEISDDLITTLSTTTRSLMINSNKYNTKILLIDTVGFISRLPHYMVDAFKSTLEESLSAI
jgi:GTP-binding protein HflX